MDIIDEPTTESTADPTTEPVATTKKDRKLAQLAAARESAKNKKRQREDDLSTMKETLTSITALLSTKKEKEEESDEEATKKPKRPTRVTKEPDEKEDAVAKVDTWSTSAIRTCALMGLAAGSYYFSNIYGTHQQQQPVQPKKKVASVHTTQHHGPAPKARTVVGTSGFCM